MDGITLLIGIAVAQFLLSTIMIIVLLIIIRRVEHLEEKAGM